MSRSNSHLARHFIDRHYFIFLSCGLPFLKRICCFPLKLLLLCGILVICYICFILPSLLELQQRVSLLRCHSNLSSSHSALPWRNVLQSCWWPPSFISPLHTLPMRLFSGAIFQTFNNNIKFHSFIFTVMFFFSTITLLCSKWSKQTNKSTFISE